MLVAACGDNVREGDAKLVVTKGDALRTTEDGGTAMFTVGFDRPTSMMVTLTSTKTTEGTVSPSTITLDPDDLDGVLVTVTGMDDTAVDGDQPYQIHVNAGERGADIVDLTNVDDESATGSVTVTPTSGTTTEAGGTATFTVVLTAMPTADVTIPLSSSNTDEGTVSAAQLVFTSANWNVAQTVTVTGQDDDIDDGNKAYLAVLAAATSTDARYSGMEVGDVMLTNTDDDTRGFEVSAISGMTGEDLTTATFTVVLTSEPTADVTIDLTSDDTTEGTVGASITFTPGNWDTAQTVTVTGVDDTIDDGDIMYSIVTAAATSTDTTYSGQNPADVSVVNVDNDGATISVTAPAGGLVTNENGLIATFTIVLASQPSANVTIPVVSSDLGEGATLVTAVTFTPLDWNLPQTVEVQGVDDVIADGPVQYMVVVGPSTSTDTAYDNVDPADVAATNNDNDIAAITVFPTDGLFVSEFLDTDAFTIVLTSQPTSTVTIPVMSSDATEGTIFPTNIIDVTFTPLDWNIPQTVTVRGVDDLDFDGNIVFSIVTGPAVSLDAAFNNQDPPDVTVTNFDNETANVFVQARKTLSTNETGGPSGQGTFRVRLTTVPTAAVTCTLASNDLTEGQVSPQTIVLTTTNFQTVTVTGIDDAIDDGDVRYTILTAPCTSTDPDYNQRNPRDVSVLNIDND
jgi:hypothetical protein